MPHKACSYTNVGETVGLQSFANILQSCMGPSHTSPCQTSDFGETESYGETVLILLMVHCLNHLQQDLSLRVKKGPVAFLTIHLSVNRIPVSFLTNISPYKIS